METVTESADPGAANGDASVEGPAANGANGAAGPSTNGAVSEGAVADAVGGEAAGTFSAEATLGALSDPVGEMASGDGSDNWSVTAAEESPGESDGRAGGLSDGEEPLLVRELKAEIGGLDTRSREMLAHYAESGPGTPLDAHLAAGGDGDRTHAYAHNRRLRTRGLVEHVGRSYYDYRLRDLLREELDGATGDELDAYVEAIEETVLD
jgi:hypothetical protein